MRTMLAIMVLAVTALPNVAQAVPVGVDQTAVKGFVGSWSGPFVGTTFIFEIQKNGTGWSGRYRSDKSSKWLDLQNVEVLNDTLKFSFVSQPPSSFKMKLDPSGAMLIGTATFGPHEPLPLTLKRIS